MARYSLEFIAVFVSLTGLYFLAQAFFAPLVTYPNKRNNRKSLILKGYTGILLLFFLGILILYFYSLQPIPERLIRENREKEDTLETLPDISMDDLTLIFQKKKS